jgi:hypothetical protein
MEASAEDVGRQFEARQKRLPPSVSDFAVLPNVKVLIVPMALAATRSATDY